MSIAQRMTNVHGDSYSPNGRCRFSAAFELDGARYHIWLRAIDPQSDYAGYEIERRIGGKEPTLYKNLPFSQNNKEPTRYLRTDSKFAREALAPILARLPELRDEAKAKYEAEEAAKREAYERQAAARRVEAAAPELLTALRGLLLCMEQHARLGHLQFDPRVEAARAAIAKAEGRE